jgi:hypothetical protein
MKIVEFYEAGIFDKQAPELNKNGLAPQHSIVLSF